MRQFKDAVTHKAGGVESAIVGTRPCLRWLQKGQVEVLFLDRAYGPAAGWACDGCGVVRAEAERPRTCPECGRGEVRSVDLKEEMVRLAELCGASVERVDADEILPGAGGVGCLLKESALGTSGERSAGHYVVIASTLAIFWVFLSGHFTALLLGIGAASVLIVVLLLRRMDRVDDEVSWTRPSFGLFRYLMWLLWAAIKASADVAWRIWNPALPISPTWKRVDTEIKTPLKKTLYANSITLTPGTLTTSAHETHLMVHSLSEANIEELQAGEMQRRIRALEL